MAGTPNMIVVLGSSPDSFYIGYGRRHFVQNMSPSFENHAKTELNISMTTWVSVSEDLESWVTFNVATDKFHFNASINPDIRDHLSGTNGKAAVDFVSFSDEPNAGYFVNGKGEGVWNAVLDDWFVQKLGEMQREIPNFDRGLTGILFGKGRNHICLFKGGFVANLEDEAGYPEHALYKVCSEFSEGWCIERGSTLCFYDPQYFFLKFKKPGERTTQLRWNLPPNMAEKLASLKETMAQPEEQLAQIQEDQQWMQLASARINSQMQANNMLVNIMNRGSLSILAAATGGTVVERWY